MSEYLKNCLKNYFKNRPLFLGIIRAKELELYQRFLAKKKANDNIILDFGCGDGFFMKNLKGDLGLDIVGLEIDKQAANKARKAGVYKQVILYNGKKIPFEDNHFSLIISNCVLEHVQDLKQNLREINRVLKKGGRFYCTVMADKWEDYLFGSLFFGKFYREWMRKKQQHVNLLSVNDWSRSFKQAGLTVIELVGYLDKRASRWIDLMHYFSIASLIAYKLTGRWVIFPRQYDLIPADELFSGLVRKDVSFQKASALFFVLKKQ